MVPTSADARCVLVVHDDERVRSALVEFINATPGFSAIGAGTSSAQRRTEPRIALVAMSSATDGAALACIRRLAADVPVVAVSDSGSSALAARVAGASRFCEMDGNLDALLTALRSCPQDATG